MFSKKNITALAICGLVFSWGLVAVTPALANTNERQNIDGLEGMEYVEGEVIVKYNTTRGIAAAQQVLARHAVRQAEEEAGFVLLQAKDGKSTVEMIADLQGDPAVALVEPNYIRRIKAQATPWGVSDDGVQADAVLATSGLTGAGVVVAVIDSGVDHEHEDLADSMWDAPSGRCLINSISVLCPNHGWDFATSGDALDGYNGRDNNPMDGHGHGTHVSGIVAAADNEEGVVGVAPDTEIMAVRVFGDDGSATTLDVVSGINFAVENNADVINLSIGGYGYSATEHEAIDNAWEAGVVVVAAAGNESENELSYPAAFANSIAVGAIQQSASDLNPYEDMEMRLAYFSNYGYTDIVAPGRSIESAVLDDEYETWDGTSMAAPHIAGVAALILEANPTFTPDQVKHVLEVTASDQGATGRDQYYGSGLAQAVQAVAGSYGGLVLSANYITDDSTYESAPIATYPELSADGASEIIVRARVSNSSGAFISGQDVLFSTDLGSVSAVSDTTDSDGYAEVTLTSSSSPGVATVTADAGSYGEETIEVTMANVLLVSDDAGWTEGSNLSWYSYSTLLANDVRFLRWNTYKTADEEVFPTSEEMAQYDAVLWFTGEYWIDDEAQTEIAEYMDGGGNFMTTGQDQLLRIRDETLGGNATDIIYADYLKAEYGQDMPDDSSTITGSDVFDGLEFTLFDPGYIDGLLPDWVTVLDGGIEAGTYASDEVAAVVVDDLYQSIFLPFGFESVEARADRETLMNSVLSTFVGITGVATSLETAATVMVSWDEYTTSGVTSYTVSYGTDTLAENIGTVSASEATIELSDLAPGMTYYVKVQANLEGGGTTAFSQIEDFTTLDGVPTGLSTSDALAKSIKVSWDAPDENVTSYTLRYSTKSDFSKNAGSVSNITGTSKTVSNLLTSKKYYFKVKAEYEGGSSEYSSSIYKRTLPKKGKVNKVKTVDGGKSLRCRNIPRVTKMTAKIYKKKGSGWRLVKTKKKTKNLDANTVKIKITGLAVGSYRAKVRGTYNKKHGTWSKYKKFKVN